MKALEVLQPGPLTTLQDGGRCGYRHWGLAQAGVMDRPAQFHANWLVGNAPDAPVLEVAQGLLSLRARQPVTVAVTGGHARIERNGDACWPGWAITLQGGDILKLKGLRTGLFATLAVAGGFLAEPVLGSVSTDLFAGLGGWQGRALQAGDVLTTGVCKGRVRDRGLRLPENDGRVRVLPGPARERLGQAAWDRLLGTSWQVGGGSGRMATLLHGDPLPVPEMHLPSRMVLPGTVQVPPSGLPMVLQVDAQTTGGYPELAVVLEWDLWKLAQARPGQRVWFEAVSSRQARALRDGWQHHWQRLFTEER